MFHVKHWAGVNYASSFTPYEPGKEAGQTAGWGHRRPNVSRETSCALQHLRL